MLSDTAPPPRPSALGAWIVLGVGYLALAFAWLVPADTETSAGVPVEWVGFLVRVLQFHLGLLVALVALVALVRRRPRVALAAVPLLLFTLAPVAWTYVAGRDVPATAGEPTRIMTVNLLVSNEDHDATIDEIRRADPDVLVLQEYDEDWDQALQAAFSDSDFADHRAETREDSFGTAIYARETLDEPGTPVPLGSDEVPQTRSVVDVGGTDVAVYNVHLLPPIGLDYVREGRRQFDDLVAALRDEELPAVVVGDLNLTETTPQHARLREIGMRDAWDLRGRGRGATWPNNSVLRYLPGLRLDHVYVSEQLAVVDVRIVDGHGSDHRALVADLALRKR